MDLTKFQNFLGVYGEQRLWKEYPSTTVFCQPPGQLWLSYPFAFGDVEGTLSQLNQIPAKYCDRMAQLLSYDEEEATEKKERFLDLDTEALRDSIANFSHLCGVSCWTQHENEKESLWKHFCEGTSDGVAICTTAGNLMEAINTANNSSRAQSKPRLVEVEYIDYSEDLMERDGYRHLLHYVSHEWSFENEVRVHAKSYYFRSLDFTHPHVPSDEEMQEIWKKQRDDSALLVREMRQCSTEGFHLPLCLSKLNMKVVTSPDTGIAALTKVRDLLSGAGLDPGIAQPSQFASAR